MEIREINNKEDWENFLAGCIEKTFLDSWSWGEFNEKMGRKSWRFGVWNEGKIIACALVSKIGAKRGTFLFVAHAPVTIEGLQIKDKKEIVELILLRLKELALQEKAGFIRISPIWQRTAENIKIFKDLKFRDAPIHMHPETAWELGISKAEEEILSGMRKTTRYLVRQAEKNLDISVTISRTKADLEDFNRVYEETGKRQHFVIYNKKYIENEFDTFLKNNEALLFLGKYKGETAVVAMFIFWQGACYYHHSGSLPKFNKFPVSYLLQWEAIKEAKQRGCLIYNFWGIAPKPSHPWARLSLFKTGFGGYPREYVAAQDYIISQKYWINYLIEKARKIKRGF